MATKTIDVIINTVTVHYNGNSKEFERFVKSIICEFLNSCSITKSNEGGFIGNVEKIDEQT